MASTARELHRALVSGYPLIVVASSEEERILALVKRIAEKAKPQPLPVFVWDCVSGFGDEEALDPLDALSRAEHHEGPGMFVFKDLFSLLDDRRVARKLRDAASAVRGTGRFFLLLSESGELPELLKPVSYVILSPLPDAEEMRGLVETRLPSLSAEEGLLDRIVDALRGLTLTEAEHVIRRVSHLVGAPPALLNAILEEKEQVTRKAGVLEFVHNRLGMDSLGGLDQLKEWLYERRRLFLPEARRRGLPLPRGILLMGMSGCGKSLAVKVIAQEWGLPLFRLDMNLIFSGVHGSPEWAFHRALSAAESVAPAVLWIDEIEMGVAGYHEGETGSLTRIFSTFLTWMQEHTEPVFVAATANRINLLPAEIIRKGRFDQVFFVDLPNDEERKEILAIHLRRHGLDPENFDLILLSSAMRGWNGAEIEQAVAQAVITAYAAGKPVTQDDLLTACAKIVPLSRTMEEQIKAIRSWAKGRALPATKPRGQ